MVLLVKIGLAQLFAGAVTIFTRLAGMVVDVVWVIKDQLIIRADLVDVDFVIGLTNSREESRKDYRSPGE